MPVNVLYCEGASKSPDVRLLRSVLAGTLCTIRPSGGKYGMGDRILAHREINSSASVAGILDRDFDNDNEEPTQSPRIWETREGVNFGWRWERCEIENYLIDPIVAQNAIGMTDPETKAFEIALVQAVEMISVYTAARNSLSLSRKRFTPLSNCWGRKGQLDHPFPDTFSEEDCVQGMHQIIQNYEDCIRINEDELRAGFYRQLPEYQNAGLKRQNYLTFYSGKDLLLAMQSSIEEIGFGSPKVFRERVLVGIENSANDVWTWLPEWVALREQVIQ